MKQNSKCIKNLLEELCKIHLVDKCLLLFMLILLLQSAYSLFVQGNLSREAGNVDIIIRTSAAAIFGYFLSANFMKRSVESRKKTSVGNTPLVTDTRVNSGIKSQMGFADHVAEEDLMPGEATSMEQVDGEADEEQTSQLQIIIATAIGLFCLLTLIFMRDVVGGNLVLGATSSSAATVAQFRDFVSGCVGFLIGCPTSGSRGR